MSIKFKINDYIKNCFNLKEMRKNLNLKIKFQIIFIFAY
ncbi:hypothetical protein CSG_4250 [Campylobacter fetus subsp. venerealis str. 84-112]|uniref:Uncharacterized protein n=1 Tax=Campylobacter fetus subsp. fetus (strain 82-40) TaxID=360106 RepID=A0RMW4_CAMFF|nr:hypothetical protein CFF8240_0345 [Campylobacter fetus subsp. fetus 82-40]CDF64345.1 hypothetical protein CSG_4250 [Campylobacter fetus subsp. venerealis str. 84-112]